jgi:beta-lactam-binding protein with PASTA domain
VLKFITSKPLWVNILVAIGVVLVLIFTFFALLGVITGHGKYEKVPSIIGQNFVAAKTELEAKGFSVEVADSTYTPTVGALAVTKQVPDADAVVKAGRTIYLTLNRAVPPQVDMPSLIGFSFKSAEMYLTNVGLKLGDTTYKPDFAKNSVLDQLLNGQSIKAGTKIPSGSTISLVLGSGVGSSNMNVPDLIGMTLDEARTMLGSMNLGVGSVVAMGSIADSSAAFVVKQNPEVFSEPTPGQKNPNKTRAGSTFDLYISATAPVRDTTNTIKN